MRRKELCGGKIYDRLLCGLQELHVLTVCQVSAWDCLVSGTFSFESRLTDYAQVQNGASFPDFVVFLLPLILKSKTSPSEHFSFIATQPCPEGVT